MRHGCACDLTKCSNQLLAHMLTQASHTTSQLPMVAHYEYLSRINSHRTHWHIGDNWFVWKDERKKTTRWTKRTLAEYSASAILIDEIDRRGRLDGRTGTSRWPPDVMPLDGIWMNPFVIWIEADWWPHGMFRSGRRRNRQTMCAVPIYFWAKINVYTHAHAHKRYPEMVYWSYKQLWCNRRCVLVISFPSFCNAIWRLESGRVVCDWHERIKWLEQTTKTTQNNLKLCKKNTHWSWIVIHTNAHLFAASFSASIWLHVCCRRPHELKKCGSSSTAVVVGRTDEFHFERSLN